MSDRREAVATALRRAFDIHQAGAFMVTAPDYVPRPNAWHYELADVALSVIDAEPTEAEIIAAREMWFRLPDDMTADECMRRVLIAARTARQGGQG